MVPPLLPSARLHGNHTRSGALEAGGAKALGVDAPDTSLNWELSLPLLSTSGGVGLVGIVVVVEEEDEAEAEEEEETGDKEDEEEVATRDADDDVTVCASTCSKLAALVSLLRSRRLWVPHPASPSLHVHAPRNCPNLFTVSVAQCTRTGLAIIFDGAPAASFTSKCTPAHARRPTVTVRDTTNPREPSRCLSSRLCWSVG